MRTPSFESYGNYASENYGAHSLVFTDAEGNQFYYSYKTLVAFRSLKTGLVCRKNVWSNTTGKHLNWIQPDHGARISINEFQTMLNSI